MQYKTSKTTKNNKNNKHTQIKSKKHTNKQQTNKQNTKKQSRGAHRAAEEERQPPGLSGEARRTPGCPKTSPKQTKQQQPKQQNQKHKIRKIL